MIDILYNHLRGAPCWVFGSGMKVGVQASTDDLFYYPDLHVACEQARNEHFNSKPKLIIEVLSDSTERKDRAEKFYNYRKLESLARLCVSCSRLSASRNI